MPEVATNRVEIKASEKVKGLSNIGKLLLAYMEITGITCAKTISDKLGIPVRTIQRLKLDCATAIDGAATSATCAIDGVKSDVELTPDAPSMAFSALARVEEKLLPPKQEETASKLASLSVADEIISDVAKWIGDEKCACQWTATTVRTFGSEIVQQAWHKLKTDMATGSLVAQPIKTLTSICQRMKAEGVGKPSAKVAPSKEDRANMEFIPSRYGPGKWVPKSAGALQ